MSIEVTHYYGVHQGGTKDYHIYLFQGATDAIFVKRFGKTGSQGQALVEQVSAAKANAHLNKLLKERDKKGYGMRRETHPVWTYTTMAEASHVLPAAHRTQLSAAAVQKVETGSGKGAKGSFDPLAEERAKLVEQMKAQAAQEEREAEMAALKANPNFGMF